MNKNNSEPMLHLSVDEKKLKGKLIVIDSLDYSRKRELISELLERAKATGYEVVAISDFNPKTTVKYLSQLKWELLNNVILHPSFKVYEHLSKTVNQWISDNYYCSEDNTLILMYSAIRSITKELIEYLLSHGICVILDRWVYSTCVYQCKVGSGSLDLLKGISKGLNLKKPDLSIFLNLTEEVLLKRFKDKNEHYMYDAWIEKLQRCREEYLELAKSYPEDKLIYLEEIKSSGESKSISELILELEWAINSNL